MNELRLSDKEACLIYDAILLSAETGALRSFENIEVALELKKKIFGLDCVRKAVETNPRNAVK